MKSFKTLVTLLFAFVLTLAFVFCSPSYAGGNKGTVGDAHRLINSWLNHGVSPKEILRRLERSGNYVPNKTKKALEKAAGRQEDSKKHGQPVAQDQNPNACSVPPVNQHDEKLVSPMAPPLPSWGPLITVAGGEKPVIYEAVIPPVVPGMRENERIEIVFQPKDITLIYAPQFPKIPTPALVVLLLVALIEPTPLGEMALTGACGYNLSASPNDNSISAGGINCTPSGDSVSCTDGIYGEIDRQSGCVGVYAENGEELVSGCTERTDSNNVVLYAAGDLGFINP